MSILKSEEFKGGKLTCMLGGSEIDLRECKLAQGKHVLDIFVMFGGLELWLPADWKVNSKINPVLGGFDDNRKNIELVSSEGAELVLKGSVVFGGIELKT